MDKITEELITAMIKRIEKIEERLDKGLVPTQKQNVGTNKPGMATGSQLNYIKQLGGNPWTDMTSQEASKEIDKLKAMKKRKETEQTIPHINMDFDISKLSPEEIKQLEDQGVFL
jgi:hypothetical protein